MKKYCRALFAFLAVGMSSAMEIGYHDQADIDWHNQYMLDKPEVEYVLVDLRQKSPAPRNIQQKAADTNQTQLHEQKAPDSMETNYQGVGSNIFSSDYGNDFFDIVNQNHSYDVLISSNDGQRLHELCQKIEEAIKSGVKDSQLADEIAEYLRYKSYSDIPRNKWYSLQPYCLLQKEWQVDETFQSDSKSVNYERFIEGTARIKRIETYVIAQIMYKYDVVNGFKLRFKYNKRHCIICKRQKDNISDDGDQNENDNQTFSEIDT